MSIVGGSTKNIYKLKAGAGRWFIHNKPPDLKLNIYFILSQHRISHSSYGFPPKIHYKQ